MARPTVVALSLGVFILSCTQPALVSHADNEQRLVAEVLSRSARSLEQHDWSTYSTVWANDSDISVMHPGSREWVSGWKAVAQKYRALVSDTSFHFRAVPVRHDIHVSPSGDMAWVTQEDSLYFLTRGKTSALVQWSTAVLEKRGGRWKLIHAHASQFPSGS